MIESNSKATRIKGGFRKSRLIAGGLILIGLPLTGCCSTPRDYDPASHSYTNPAYHDGPRYRGFDPENGPGGSNE